MKKQLSIILALCIFLTLTACGSQSDAMSDNEVYSMPYSVEFNGITMKGTYSGAVLDKTPEGSGSFSYEFGSRFFYYDGKWSEGQISENGYLETNLYIVHFNDGIDRSGHYKGDVLNGIAEGQGAFSSINSEDISYTYNGEWKAGLFSGQGRMKFDDDGIYVEKGTFVDGEFSPTPAEFFAAFGTLKDKEFTLSDNAKEFLNTYPDAFLNNDFSVVNDKIDTEFKYQDFAKNPSQFGDKAVVIKNLTVVQIIEDTNWGKESTFIIAQDSSYNVYATHIYGYCDNIYENSIITLTMLPLDYYSYPNIYNEHIHAIACAGICVE